MNFAKALVWFLRIMAVLGAVTVMVDGAEQNVPLPKTSLAAALVLAVFGLFSWLLDRAFKAPKQEIPRNLKVIFLWVVGAGFFGWMLSFYTGVWWVGAIIAAIIILFGLWTTYGTPPKKKGD